jgi:hypothetical protein
MAACCSDPSDRTAFVATEPTRGGRNDAMIELDNRAECLMVQFSTGVIRSVCALRDLAGTWDDLHARSGLTLLSPMPGILPCGATISPLAINCAPSSCTTATGWSARYR